MNALKKILGYTILALVFSPLFYVLYNIGVEQWGTWWSGIITMIAPIVIMGLIAAAALLISDDI